MTDTILAPPPGAAAPATSTVESRPSLFRWLWAMLQHVSA